MSFKDECASQGIDSDEYTKKALPSQISTEIDDKPISNGGIRSETADDIFQSSGDVKVQKKIVRTDSHYNIGKIVRSYIPFYLCSRLRLLNQESLY